MEYLVVLLVVVVFMQTRITELRPSVFCLASQSAVIAGACLVIGCASSAGIHALLPGILTICVKVIFIPGAILHLVGKLSDEKEIISESNVNYSTLAAAFFLFVGFVVVNRLIPNAGLGGDIIAAAIMMVMTGLAIMVLRKRAIIQMIGLITLENGIYLLGLLMTEGLPMIVELGVFLDVLIAVVVLVILTSRMRLSFMTTDTSVMKKLKG